MLSEQCRQPTDICGGRDMIVFGGARSLCAHIDDEVGSANPGSSAESHGCEHSAADVTTKALFVARQRPGSAKKDLEERRDSLRRHEECLQGHSCEGMTASRKAQSSVHRNLVARA